MKHKPLLPPPQGLVTTILLCVFVNSASLGTSYEWNHAVFALLCLVYFTYRNVFKDHSWLLYSPGISVLLPQCYTSVLTYRDFQ